MLALSEWANKIPGLPFTLYDSNNYLIMRMICFRPNAQYVVHFKQSTTLPTMHTVVYDKLDDFTELINFVERTISEQAHLHEARILYNAREILCYRGSGYNPRPTAKIYPKYDAITDLPFE